MTSLPPPGRQEARPRHRSRHLRRLSCLRRQLQGMEQRRAYGAADRSRSLRPESRWASGSTASTASRPARAARAARCISPAPACIASSRPASTVCPTGASYKRAEDGIVLVNESICIGCKLCSWACPYGAREYDYDVGVMKKCTLCIDRSTTRPSTKPTACRPASPPAPSRRGISAISAIPTPMSRSWSRSARVTRSCPRWATSRSTAICRRARAAMPPAPARRRRALAPSPQVPAGAHPFLRWIDRVLSR